MLWLLTLAPGLPPLCSLPPPIFLALLNPSSHLFLASFCSGLCSRPQPHIFLASTHPPGLPPRCSFPPLSRLLFFWPPTLRRPPTPHFVVLYLTQLPSPLQPPTTFQPPLAHPPPQFPSLFQSPTPVPRRAGHTDRERKRTGNRKKGTKKQRKGQTKKGVVRVGTPTQTS